MIYLVVIVVLFVIGVMIFMRSPRFGGKANGSRARRMQASPNYKNGQFQNLEPTPALAENMSYWSVSRDFILQRPIEPKPLSPLPVASTDLKALPLSHNCLVWFGHSSYYMQVNGTRILVDPVFSRNASPLSFTTSRYPATNHYTAADMPPIDILLISHDHYDHFDYNTIQALQPHVKQVVTGLGVGAHLERWGYTSTQINELDWHESIDIGGLQLIATPARHFSGRGFTRNETLWLSFVLRAPGIQLFIGGDSGYGNHFKDIAARYGSMQLAILECGQYNTRWPYIHMQPEQTVQAALDLQAGVLLPVHWAKFTLGMHPWREPIERVTAAAKQHDLPIVTPGLGQVLDWTAAPVENAWWQGH